MIDIHAKKKETIRVFFAIKPDVTTLNQLSELARQLTTAHGGKETKKTKIHLTLLFLGEVAINRLGALRDAAKTVIMPTFNFPIDEIRYWKRNQIIYACASRQSPGLTALVNRLRRTLSAHDFSFDQRSFIPHITLARKIWSCKKTTPLAAPINWHVKEFFLIQSKHYDHGIHYIQLGNWPLYQPILQKIKF